MLVNNVVNKWLTMTYLTAIAGEASSALACVGET